MFGGPFGDDDAPLFIEDEFPCFPDTNELGELLPPDSEDGEQGR